MLWYVHCQQLPQIVIQYITAFMTDHTDTLLPQLKKLIFSAIIKTREVFKLKHFLFISVIKRST